MDKSNGSELEFLFQKTPKRGDPYDLNPLLSEARMVRESRESEASFGTKILEEE